MVKYRLVQPASKKYRLVEEEAPARPRFIPKDADGIPLPTIAFDVVQTDPLGLRSLRAAAGLPDATGGLYGGPKKLPATGDIFNKPMISSADDIRNMKFDRLDTPRAMQADKMSRAQSLALGINDFNPVRLATGDRGYEKALTESVQDNPVTTRIGQATALTAGGSAQLTNRAILNAPKLVPAAVAARVAGQSVPARLARYGGRLATLAGVGAADYAVYNAAAEAPNVAREIGAELPTMGERAGFAAQNLGDPAGWAPLPALSLAYRLGRGGVTAAKNTTQATLAANKSAPRPEVMAAGVPSLPPIQWRGGSFTPADVQARVAMGGIDPATNSSVREIAIDKLLKEGFNPDEAEKAVRLMSYDGYSTVDEMLFEIDNNLAELATAVGRVNRPGQQVLRDEFKARREAMPEEIRTALRQAVGASGDDLETFALKMTEQATEASADGYKAAYGKTISDDAWQRLLGLFGETPDAVDAARKGAELARNSARRDPAKLEAARQLDELAGVLGSGGVPNAKLSTMALDFLDRGLGRKVSVATRQGDNAYSASLLDFRNALRGSGLDAETGLNVPRTIYAQYKAAQKAVEFGEKSFGKSTSLKDMKAQFAAAMKQADEAAEDGIGEGSSIIDNALMMGWVRGAENAIDMAENPATLIRQLYGSQRQREKLVSMLRELPDEAPAGIKADTTKRKKALVGSVRPDYKFDFSLSTGERAKGTTSVRSLFDRQRDMIESERRTVGGSPTAGAADAIANQGGDQRRLAGALDMLRAPQEIPWKIAAAVAERITQPMIYNPAVSRELGELLATRGKDRLLAVIDEIRQRQAATGRGPKPPTPTIPPPSTPIRAGGFAGFGGKSAAVEAARNADTVQDFAEQIVAAKYAPRKIKGEASYDDYVKAETEALQEIAAWSGKGNIRGSAGQQLARSSAGEPTKDVTVLEQVTASILRARGLDPSKVVRQRMVAKPTPTEAFSAERARPGSRFDRAYDDRTTLDRFKPTTMHGLPGLRTDFGSGVAGMVSTGMLPMEEDATLEDKLARAGTGFLLGFGASKGGRVGARMLAEAKAAPKATVGKPKRDFGTKAADAAAIASLTFTPPAQAQGSDGAAELEAANERVRVASDRVLQIEKTAIPQLEADLRLLEDPNADPRKLQELLANRDFDLGPNGVDGRIGPDTRKAIAQNVREIKGEIAFQRQELEKARKEEAAARDGVKQVEMKSAQAAAQSNPVSAALNKAAPWVGAAAGIYLGYRTRNSAVLKSRAAAKAAADRANALLNAKPVSRGINTPDSVNTRAANLNEFWRQGGAGENVPFRANQSGKWSARPRAAEPSSLFAPPSRFNSQDVAVMGSGVAEAGVAHMGVKDQEQKIKQAKADVEKYAAAGDVAGMQRALKRQKEAEVMRDLFVVAERAGLFLSLSRVSAGLKNPYAKVSPDVAAAERERALILQALKK